MKRYLIICALISSCCTAQKKDMDKQLDNNKAALILSDEAKNIVKESELSKEDKSKIYAALGSGQSAIIGSSAIIAGIKELNNKLIAENTNAKDKIKFQAKIIWYEIGIIVLLLLPWVIKIIKYFNPAWRIKDELAKLNNKP